jgi:hypothetical protein
MGGRMPYSQKIAMRRRSPLKFLRARGITTSLHLEIFFEILPEQKSRFKENY